MFQATIASVALLAVGLVIGQAARPAAPPLLIERNQDSPLPLASTSQKLPTTTQGTITTTDGSRGNAGVGDPSNSQSSLADYLCGARTKKGTPCTRRVHGPVRCWQHRGLPAMLPLDKLIVKE